MLDISERHPFEACAAFAVRWLACLAAYDLASAEAIIDVNESGVPFSESFPPPDGFTYAHPDRVRGWCLNIVAADERGLGCDFEVPFAEPEYRPMQARFYLRRLGSRLEVRFQGLVPT
jgi:hypothetical protein